MFKKTVTYTDFLGEERTEDCYFNLTRSELTELSQSVSGGLDVMLERMLSAKDNKGMMEWFKKIILMSYGIRSDDGRRFMKSEEISKEFSETGAYDEIFMWLITGGDQAVAEFINGVVPPKIAEEANKLAVQRGMTVVK
jgi:hypothetical protein